jgi:hypothetical protein
MVVVPLIKPESKAESCAGQDQSNKWARFAASGTLIASGVLLLNGKRRAGMVAAAAGTALALLDQPETLRSWWKVLPVYLDDIQRMLDQVEEMVEDLAVRRDRLRRILAQSNDVERRS